MPFPNRTTRIIYRSPMQNNSMTLVQMPFWNNTVRATFVGTPCTIPRPFFKKNIVLVGLGCSSHVPECRHVHPLFGPVPKMTRIFSTCFWNMFFWFARSSHPCLLITTHTVSKTPLQKLYLPKWYITEPHNRNPKQSLCSYLNLQISRTTWCCSLFCTLVESFAH